MVADLAKVNKLSRFADESLIEDYARAFSQDPDWVYENKSFDTIMLFATKWKETSEYQDRYMSIEKMINESK